MGRNNGNENVAAFWGKLPPREISIDNNDVLVDDSSSSGARVDGPCMMPFIQPGSRIPREQHIITNKPMVGDVGIFIYTATDAELNALYGDERYQFTLWTLKNIFKSQHMRLGIYSQIGIAGMILSLNDLPPDQAGTSHGLISEMPDKLLSMAVYRKIDPELTMRLTYQMLTGTYKPAEWQEHFGPMIDQNWERQYR